MERDFLEWCDADDLKDFVQTRLQFQSLLQDGDEQVGAHRGPDLNAHSVFRIADKAPDAEVLLDPAEKQFDLPASPVQLGDLQGRSGEQVGEENQREFLRGVAVADPAQWGRVAPFRRIVAQLNRLIARKT